MLLHIRSSASYKFLRKHDILPLPARSTIARYLKQCNAGIGFNDDFLSLFAIKLAEQARRIPNADHGILVFDEMSVRTGLSVNMKTMTFDGLADFGEEVDSDIVGQSKTLREKQAKHALVFMYSSLTAKFIQPIGMFLSHNQTPGKTLAKLIIAAIVRLENAGAKIHAITSDGAKTNKTVWSELGVKAKYDSPVICSFDNPVDDGDEDETGKKRRQVFVLSDTPHLIKCVRNLLFNRKSFKV